jgi:hypothetical protein
MKRVIRLRMMIGHLEYKDPLALLPEKDTTIRDFIQKQSSWETYKDQKQEQERRRKQAPPPPYIDMGELEPIDSAPFQMLSKFPKLSRYCTFELD